MITPRRTRLLRAADLAGFRSHLVAAARVDREAFVLVPTQAAGEQLRRTLSARIGPTPAGLVIGTRTDLYDQLLSRLRADARVLSGFEREALIAAAARDAEEAGAPPPFHLRPALVAEMLALYDYLRRLHRTVDDFERLLTGELEPAADSDQGAAQLLEQTRFLAATFRGYEARLGETGALDEHAARQQLIEHAAATPLTRIVIAVGDRPADPDGLWPADVALLTSISGLDAIDIIATDGTLEAGYLDRLRLAFVGIDEVDSPPPTPPPAIVVPAGASGELPFVLEYRDREEELEGVARRLKADRRSGRTVDLQKTALVVARPLPYLYLARDVFQGAGVPFEALDTLPLAAEPYAAALDVAMECAAAGFTRRALVALLRSPHFRFESDGVEIARESIAALDVLLADQRYLGGLERLASLEEACRGQAQPAFRAALAVAATLAPLIDPHPLVEHVDLLRSFLDRQDRPQPGNDRRDRVRSAVMLALAGLGEAYRRHDPGASGTVTDLSAAVRRWLGAQTFALRTGEGGLPIVDAQSARFADFDDVQVMGLVEGEWPERPRRNIFYPQSLLAQLEPARPDRVAIHQERDLIRQARASFRDLLMSPRLRVRVSTFALESDAVVEPSAFLDDLPAFGLSREVATLDPSVRVFEYEALAAMNEGVGNSKGSPPQEITVGSHFSATVARWARVRATGADRARARFEGEAGPWVLPRVSVSRLERYLKCPFQFYVANVLQVDEEPEDEIMRSPLERGRFLHELFETFFHEWQARGRGRITAASMTEARELFVEVCEPALASLSPSEAGLERARLFGSAVGSGIADRVFAMEAERGVEIRERLMEYELDGEFAFTGEDGASRLVRLRAKIDRVDVLADGTFRLIDYKTKYVPDRRIALQLPIYSAGVRTRLSAERGGDIKASEAMYLSFEGPEAVMPLYDRSKSFDELVTAAEHRLVQALDDIAAGHYPPRPETRNLCGMCAFVAVCRHPGGLPDEPGVADD